MKLQTKRVDGFTLIELIIVIVLLGILAVIALPRFGDFSSDARIATLNGIATQMRSTITLVQNKARAQGLRPVTNNPGSGQSGYIVDFGFGTTEVMFNTLCPESIGEFGDDLRLLDFMNESLTSDISTRIDNQYTLLGYDVPVSGVPLTQGCYIIYDSFATPNCTVTVVTEDC
ncbi:prepilin-type N-terminal cleavage/methylation domain-containing protein [Alteromonas sp. W364]|uniref:pilus assembly FimT family protein n=1 Tax=Alteromonas sp. W364 TaxID=3075610 RepID=UPI002886B75E|nr:prepilin-type N-terminal cleavage/methylation domain-containing protein [Alteromonas sp. W364]MDT0626868.1 prepilin-type N-terminal cleavage/methylation domain-containing protein [Alteromonas sp. W364]